MVVVTVTENILAYIKNRVAIVCSLVDNNNTLHSLYDLAHPFKKSFGRRDIITVTILKICNNQIKNIKILP